MRTYEFDTFGSFSFDPNSYCGRKVPNIASQSERCITTTTKCSKFSNKWRDSRNYLRSSRDRPVAFSYPVAIEILLLLFSLLKDWSYRKSLVAFTFHSELSSPQEHQKKLFSSIKGSHFRFPQGRQKRAQRLSFSSGDFTKGLSEHLGSLE